MVMAFAKYVCIYPINSSLLSVSNARILHKAKLQIFSCNRRKRTQDNLIKSVEVADDFYLLWRPSG